MRLYQHVMIAHLAATLPQIANEFLATLQLRRGRLAPVEIAHQANAERDIIKVVAVHVPAVDLAPPAISHLDLAVARRRAIANDKVISQPVLHVANVPMIIIEDARVPLPRPTVVHHDELPWRISPIGRRPIDLSTHGGGQIT